MILLIDNYDSFTYNIVQQLLLLASEEVRVVRNDVLTVDELEALQPSRLVVSPGPGRPAEAGVTCAAIRRFAGRIPIFGVCLGHQAIGEVYGARVVRARRLMHGKVSDVTADGKGVFAGLESPFKAMRYHSLALERDSLPDCLRVSATAEDGEIMGIRHATLPVEGVQFHPESIMTPTGKRLFRTFLQFPLPA